jgi:chorismate mutase
VPAPKDPKRRAEFAEAARKRMLGKKQNLSPEQKERQLRGLREAAKARQGKPRPDMQGDRNPMRRPEVAKKISEAKRGQKISAEQRAQIAETLRGRRYPVGWGRENRKVGYAAVHYRLKRDRGVIATLSCEVCGEPAEHWALSHETTELEFGTRRAGGPIHAYSLDPADYIAMCGPCHRRYDSGTLSL